MHRDRPAPRRAPQQSDDGLAVHVGDGHDLDLIQEALLLAPAVRLIALPLSGGVLAHAGSCRGPPLLDW